VTDAWTKVAHQVLVVMAKAPRPGRVKTRLTGEYPVGAIVELYRCLLDDTLALGLSIPNTQVAVMAPPEDLHELATLCPAGVRGVAQQGSGLAAALTSVFATFTAEGSRRVVAFNSDSPHLPRRVLDEAFAALLTHDLVAGPTDDGGYYLVGATSPHAGLFDPAPMGTESALESLLANARAKGLTYRLTEEWFDVDVASDLPRFAEALRRDPSAAPRTAALLRSWSNQAGADAARGSGPDSR
jgi:rSAM/selenodomain-associated transferase 1